MCTKIVGGDSATWDCCGEDAYGCAAPAPVEADDGSSQDRPFRFAVEEALSLICGQRMEFYGPPWENLEDIAATWTPYVARAVETKGALDGVDVCMLMAMLKCVRQVRGYHADSTADAAGYAELAEVLSDEQARQEFILKAAEEIANPDARSRFKERMLQASERYQEGKV